MVADFALRYSHQCSVPDPRTVDLFSVPFLYRSNGNGLGFVFDDTAQLPIVVVSVRVPADLVSLFVLMSKVMALAIEPKLDMPILHLYPVGIAPRSIHVEAPTLPDPVFCR